MTGNQNMNKTTMKYLQLQQLLFKTASRMPKMFPKTFFFFEFVCSFFSNRWTSLEARLSVIILSFHRKYYNWISYETFLFPFATRKLIQASAYF